MNVYRVGKVGSLDDAAANAIQKQLDNIAKDIFKLQSAAGASKGTSAAGTNLAVPFPTIPPVGSPSTGGGAAASVPDTAPVILSAPDAALPNGLVLTAGAGISLTGATVSATTQNALIKSQRITTGSILASATTPVTLTWAVAFADANYTPVASVVDSTGTLSVVSIHDFAAGTVTVYIHNSDGGSAHTGTLCVVAIHD